MRRAKITRFELKDRIRITRIGIEGRVIVISRILDVLMILGRDRLSISLI